MATRFIPERDIAKLINLYHLARTPLAGKRPTRHDRMVWAANAYARYENPSVTSTAAYKDLDALLS